MAERMRRGFAIWSHARRDAPDGYDQQPQVQPAVPEVMEVLVDDDGPEGQAETQDEEEAIKLGEKSRGW